MTRRPTIKDVARAAGVSAVTVSRVSNEPQLVVAETRERVLHAMRELGYVPNLAARTMRTNATRTIGFLVPDLTSYPNAAVAQAAEQRLADAGYGLLLASSDNRPAREVRALEVLRTRQVDGIMLYACDQEDPALRAAVASLDVPVVVLDRTLPGGGDRVLSDHATAMTEAVRYLALLGHRAMALVLPDLRIRPALERRDAFLAALGPCRLDPAVQTVLRVPPGAMASTPSSIGVLEGETAPTAVIVDGSRLLRGVIQAARAHRRTIPDQLSVIGIDGEDVAQAATPEITGIVRDFGEIGRTAAELLLRRLAEPTLPPQSVVLPSHVVLKGSCAAPG